MGRTDRGIMKLLTSKQAAESPADGGADGERAARLGCEQIDSTDFSWMLIECSSQAAQHVFKQCVYAMHVCVKQWNIMCVCMSIYTRGKKSETCFSHFLLTLRPFALIGQDIELVILFNMQFVWQYVLNVIVEWNDWMFSRKSLHIY